MVTVLSESFSTRCDLLSKKNIKELHWPFHCSGLTSHVRGSMPFQANKAKVKDDPMDTG